MVERNAAAYWRERAEETRLMAESILDAGAKQAVLEVAASYESMAARLEPTGVPRESAGTRKDGRY
jgi:hypothetical protein